MALLSALQRCFGASPAKVHAAGPLEEEHEVALRAAEALLSANAQHKVTDLYTLAAPVGHGAFAKVVECTSKVRGPDDCLLVQGNAPATNRWYSIASRCAVPHNAHSFKQLSHCVNVTIQATGDKYACKILAGKTTQGDRRSHIIKEIAILQRVGKHPYTLTFHDAFEDAGKFYLIMELCAGGELFDQIMQKVLLACFLCVKQAAAGLNRICVSPISSLQPLFFLYICICSFQLHNKTVLLGSNNSETKLWFRNAMFLR